MNSQRFIVLVIAMNLIIGIAGEIYYSPYSQTTDQVTVETHLMEDYEKEISSSTGIWGSIKAGANQVYESTIGSPIKWGYTLLRILIKGLNPFSFSPSDFNNVLEKEMARWLMFFRALFMTIAGLELYLLIKNRKQT